MVVGSSGTGYICFSVAVVIWCFLGVSPLVLWMSLETNQADPKTYPGIIIGQIRTLRGLGPLANIAGESLSSRSTVGRSTYDSTCQQSS